MCQTMGNLLRLLARDGDNCCSLPKTGDLFMDFENAKPTPDEAELFEETEDVLESAKNILLELTEYKGSITLEVIHS